MAMAHGKLCKGCGAECSDPPTPSTPILMRCPACAGKGCASCGDGHIRVTSCPRECVGREHADAMLAARFAKAGILPEAGGLNDQAACLVDAVHAVWAEESHYG